MGLTHNNHRELGNVIATAAWPHGWECESRKRPSPSGTVAFAVEMRPWFLEGPCRRDGVRGFVRENFARVAKMLSKIASWVRDSEAFHGNSTFLKTQHNLHPHPKVQRKMEAVYLKSLGVAASG